MHLLGECGADKIGRHSGGQRKRLQQFEATMSEDPFGQANVIRLNVRLEYGQYRFGHMIANENILHVVIKIKLFKKQRKCSRTYVSMFNTFDAFGIEALRFVP